MNTRTTKRGHPMSDTVPRKKLKRSHPTVKTNTETTTETTTVTDAAPNPAPNPASNHAVHPTAIYMGINTSILYSNDRQQNILYEPSIVPVSPNTQDRIKTPILCNEWIPWPEASKEIPYEKTNGIGPGEYRIASILNTAPLGQNKPYDIDLAIEGLKPRGEVKETDRANSFKTGRDGRNAWRPIHTQVVLLQEVLRRLVDYHTIDKDAILNMSPDEICEGNVYRITRLCNALHTLKIQTIATMPYYDTFDILTGAPINIPGTEMYSLFLQCKPIDVIKERMKDDYPKAHLIHILQHPYIDDPQLFMRQLDGLVITLFQDVTVILVNKKEYCIITEPDKYIRFNRITLGVPRFKVA